MIANEINGKIRIFNKIPKVFELKPNVFNYDKLDAEVHYADGFRELLEPTLKTEQHKTSIYFDVEKDVFTYHTETYTPEEIAEQKQDNEYNLYQQRQSEGLNLYLKHEAIYRLMYLNNEITKERFNEIENSINPVRLELGFGQLKTAGDLLKNIDPTKIETNVYINFSNELDLIIDQLY